MKIPIQEQVFLHAAERISRCHNDFCCSAIADSVEYLYEFGGYEERIKMIEHSMKIFSDLYLRQNVSQDIARNKSWFGPMGSAHMINSTYRDARVNAMLHCARVSKVSERIEKNVIITVNNNGKVFLQVQGQTVVTLEDITNIAISLPDGKIYSKPLGGDNGANS